MLAEIAEAHDGDLGLASIPSARRVRLRLSLVTNNFFRV